MKFKLPKINFRFLPLFLSILFLSLGLFLGKYLPDSSKKPSILEQKLIKEESVVIEIAEKASPSVVTVTAKIPERQVLEFSPFGIRRRTTGGESQDIGTGFVVSEEGLIITNKHVVNESISYKIITADDKEYDVLEINKDPNNDIAILKIDAKNSKLTPLELGSSENLKVGQFVIAIGTALGEFRHTVTTGVVSGLGRGIVAGSIYEGFVERLDDVIQTDAAINPGNSGGPLLNSSGQVIGVNVAVASGAQNIGFAIPIDIIKSSLDQFKENGKFVGKAYLGVRYEMISLSTALLNDVPQGAYVVEIIPNSAAEKAGLKENDIITKIEGKTIRQGDDISEIIKNKKVGDKISLEIYRDGEILKFEALLFEFTE